jgi:type IV pilus assembly protein PilW
MVALTISLTLIAGAIQVYVYSRKHYEDNEGIARLQETARYALSVLEPDIRMANSWGLVKGSGFIDVPTAGFNATCGTNFAGNVMATLDGTNNSYSFGCTAFGAGAVTTADTLVVRRASTVPSVVPSTALKVCSTRTLGRLVTDSSSCTPDPTGQVNDLIVNAYYLSRDAEGGRTDLPTLRRWGLTGAVSAGTYVMDQVEIVPGVEDMQIQYGIDPTGTRGTATRYINPGEATTGQIVSVRLWLLVRAETPEPDFDDTQTYVYGDRVGPTTTDNLNDTAGAGRAYKPADHFRRLLVSRTYQIRNSMGI